MSAEKPPAPSPATASFGRSCAILWAQMLPWLLLILVALLGLAVLWSAIARRKATIEEERRQASAARVDPPTNVGVWKISPRPLVDAIDLPGMIQPWESLRLKAQVSGRIVAIAKDEGDAVDAGEAVARIDARDYEARLDRSQAALVLAEQHLNRTRELFRQDALPQADLDRAEAAAKEARANATTARLALERTVLTAPFAGVINARFIALGALVDPGTEVFELLDLARVKVAIGIPESDIDFVRTLEKAAFRVDALGGRSFTGTRHSLAHKPLSQVQAYSLQLAADNPDGILRPGMFAEARILREERPKALLVPLYAVIAPDREKICFVAQDGKAQRRRVTVGRLLGQEIEITAGLRFGDALIVLGQRQVEDGGPVRITRQLSTADLARP